MKQGYGKIAIVLDRSGSMEGIAKATIDSYNEFIKGQKAAPGTADVLLVQFDDIYEVVYDQPLDKVPAMTAETFIPRGMTALRDAIGKTINTLGDAIRTLSEDQRPDSVTFVIITDGYENASKEYTQVTVAEMVKHQSDSYNWKFVFLGANQDAVLTASKFSIPARQSMPYAASNAGTRSMGQSVNSYTVSNRAAGASGQSLRGFSEEERLEAMQEDAPDKTTTTTTTP